MDGDSIMDAGAWRREALRLRERVREPEAELADLRAEREALYAVVRAAGERRALIRRVIADGYTPRFTVFNDLREQPPEDERRVIGGYPLHDALDALPCWCGKPDGHASGCPGGDHG